MLRPVRIRHYEPSLHGLGCGLSTSLLPLVQNPLSQPLLTPSVQCLAKTVLDEVCAREQYHLLESDISKDHLRFLISLQPSQKISKVVKMIKGNLQYQFGKAFDNGNLLAKGYFARSSGSVDSRACPPNVDSQISHHGYKGGWTKPLKYSNPDFKSPAFTFDHCTSILNYHLVFATQDRIPLFDETIAPRLFEYVQGVGKKHNFAIDRIGLLPDSHAYDH